MLYMFNYINTKNTKKINRGLLEQRFKIHMNLFVALSLQMFIKLILNIDKLDLFKTKKYHSNVTCLVDCNNQIRLVKDDDNWFFGIMYTVSINILILDSY